MRLLLFTIPPALVLGLLFGGRPSNLAETSFRWPLAGLAGIALQFLPIGGTAGTMILTLSFVCLFIDVGVNWRLTGFVLILAGLRLNLVVITVNQGMPVTEHAIVAAGRDARGLGPSRTRTTWRRRTTRCSSSRTSCRSGRPCGRP
jgi:hypothetical protein